MADPNNLTSTQKRIREIEERLKARAAGDNQFNRVLIEDDLDFLTQALTLALGALEHITTCVERDDSHPTSLVSNFYRLTDARRTAERSIKGIAQLAADKESGG